MLAATKEKPTNKKIKAHTAYRLPGTTQRTSSTPTLKKILKYEKRCPTHAKEAAIVCVGVHTCMKVDQKELFY